MIEVFLITIAAIAGAFLDASAINSFKRKWLNKGQTAKAKWDTVGTNNDKIRNKTYPWYYLGLYKPQFKERFPFSSTILVWMTDPWHWFQMIMLSALELGISLNVEFVWFLAADSFWGEVLEFLAIKSLFSGVFTFIYKSITRKNFGL
jgi:hypothetical protein